MELNEKLVNHHSQNGILSMKFARRGKKTAMTECYQLPPLKASRELYINPATPSEVTVYMMESAGSLLAGDVNNYDIEVGERARITLIPQSATKIYPSFHDVWSKQNINVSILSNASLSWKTEAIIPYQHAKFHGETIIHMEEDATLLWGEILTPGRVKRGETFQYRDVKTNFQVWMNDDCIIYDTLCFSPKDMDLTYIGLLENYIYVGSLWFVTPLVKEINMKKLNEKLNDTNDVKGSASLIDEKLINVRWLATDMVLLRKQMDYLWQHFKQHMDEQNN